MTIFKTKPFEVEAYLWDEKHSTLDGIGCTMMGCRGHMERPDECTGLRIVTIIGTVRVEPGDYIVKTKDGKFSVCKPDIFLDEHEFA
jgi:hypothetical protein